MARRGPLRAREAEVLELVAEGYETTEIATKLGVSYHTAKSHRARALEAMAAPNSLVAVLSAARRGLIKVDGLTPTSPPAGEQ